MRAKGNGEVGVCAENLLRIFRGENPFERVKGLDPRSIDRPAMDAQAEIAHEAEWCIETYEPRAKFEGVSMVGPESVGGNFRVSAQISEK